MSLLYYTLVRRLLELFWDWCFLLAEGPCRVSMVSFSGHDRGCLATLCSHHGMGLNAREFGDLLHVSRSITADDQHQ